MSKFSFNKEMNIEVRVTFIAKGTDTPVTGDQYKLRLYDKDVFGDDYLGESMLNDAGEGHISFEPKAFGDLFNTDTFPDFYFVLYKHNVPVFESKVMEDVDMQSFEKYTLGEGEVIDLGTYLIEAYE